MEYEFQEQEPVEETAEPVEEAPCVIDEPVRAKYEESVPAKKEKKKGAGAVIAVAVAAALIASTAAVTAFYINSQWHSREQAWQSELNNAVSELEKQLEKVKTEIPVSGVGINDGEGDGALLPSQVYAMNVDAVVAISNEGLSTNYFGQVSKTASSGSGFIISADGYVVSNYHVVQGASKLTVIMTNGQEYNAQVVGYDANNDISVLKIDAVDLPYVTLGSSDALVVGDRVAAIGNPLGELTSSMTVGYVSAKDRNVNTDGTSMNMLQTDASINSGNSGGPLFNMRGEVVGITTAKYSGTSNSGATIEGIGFAIPIDDVSKMITDIVEKGYVSGAYMGVVVEDVSSEDVRRFGLPMGALITELSPGYAAERAGLKPSDIIIELGGQRITSINDLTRVLREFEAGEEVDVKVYRSGGEVVLKIVLDEKPQQTEAQTPQETQPAQPEGNAPQYPYDGGLEDFFWPFFG